MTRRIPLSGTKSARVMHIGVFVGTSSLDFAPHFFVRFVLDRFRQLGHSVSVITPQTSIPSSLDAGILHVAATRVPGKVVARLPKDLPILNRKVLDISKRCVSSMLVTVLRRMTSSEVVTDADTL